MTEREPSPSSSSPATHQVAPVEPPSPWYRRPTVVRWLALGSLVLVAALVRWPGLVHRAVWYDEAITLMVTAGDSHPDWPDRPVPANNLAPLFDAQGAPAQIVELVRTKDAHPPLGYLAFAGWKWFFGPSIEAARSLSLLASVLSVVLLFEALRRLEVRHRWALALLYAVSTGAVHSGHEARAYALAGMLVLAAVLLATMAVARRSEPVGSTWPAVGAGLATALAFHVNYVTLFSSAVVLAWLLLRLWGAAKRPVLLALGTSLGVALPTLPVLRSQTGTGMANVEGFPGWLESLRALATMNLEILGVPTPDPGLRTLLAGLLLLAAISATAVVIWRQSQSLHRLLAGPWPLLAGLAVAPTLGVLALDLAFDRQFHLPRYLVFAGPALAVLAGYGVVATARRAASLSKRRLGWALYGVLLAILVSNTNWAGLELCPNHQFGSTTRSLAQRIATTSSPEAVVLIGEGAGHGAPAEILYELLQVAPDTRVAFFRHPEQVAPLFESVADAPDLWLLFAVDGRSLEAENAMLGLIQQSGRFAGVHREARGLHVARVGGTH